MTEIASRDPRAVYDLVAGRYDALHRSPRCAAEDRLAARMVARALKPGGRLIDIGCGTGNLLRELTIEPSRYLGVDISPAMVELARELHPTHEFVVGDVSRLGDVLFGRGPFDLAASTFGGFSYATDVEAAVDWTAAVLKPGGRALVMLYGPGWRPPLYYQLDGFMAKVDERWPLRLGTAGARALFSRRFSSVRARGATSRALEALDGWPAARTTARVAAALDWSIAGRLAPRLCRYVVIDARGPLP